MKTNNFSGKKASSTTDLIKIIGSLMILVIILLAGYKLILMGVDGGQQLINSFKSVICKLTLRTVMCS